MSLSKPSKEKRVESENLARQIAATYRKTQKIIAVTRDSGLCVVCYFKLKKKTPAVDVHHVYGRAIPRKITTSFKEHYTSLVCLCREHHEGVGIINNENSDKWYDIKTAVIRANQTPINKDFKHVSQQGNGYNMSDGRVVPDTKRL